MYKYNIFDAHCDTLCMIADNGGDIVKNKYNLDKMRMMMYNGYTQVFACFIAPRYRDNAMERFNRLAAVFDAQDFDGITPLLSVEGAEMIRSAEDVDYLRSRGVGCIALTWNHSNRLAGGADEPEQGLTALGKAVVRRMNELGILIDVSHLNDRSFYDIEKINTGIMIATHSNARALCNHRRNLTDEMFKIIRDTGGAAGINLYPPFVTESGVCGVYDVLRHIEHWLELGGEDAVGLGGDFDGVEDNLPRGISGCGDWYKLLDMLDTETADKISHRNFKRIFFG
ncbi:MAG: membrane dipeptidase [Clostridiales bacterium]|nr:membrane dipeptidase [Clostridiales bacterium]